MTDSKKLDLILEGMSELKTDMVQVKADIVELKEDVAELKTDVSVLKADMLEVKVDITELKENVHDLQTDTRLIKLQIENELRHNISIVAEGHMDLSCKVGEALASFARLEEMGVRINWFESEIRMIKERMAKPILA